ncbi:UvrD-like helicase family protein [Salana multivorans]|uniref:DNA 3'-5' helicase n=1 Tax=Salana multivorans TaxID=120377 RepID=A0A3N2D2T7_9MICO|nr:UvrD-helicase domain-containing protein [Salana multivorans]ROR93804.1 UvrD-like helicase family protein [Salana multivorans]
MAQIILGPHPKLDGSVKKAAYTFLEKIQTDDSAPGLHIEPIAGSLDPRVRTGRVDQFYRAVLVKLQGQADTATYVYLGTYPHDEAIAKAKTSSITINPLNGVAELVTLTPPVSPAAATPTYDPSVRARSDEAPAAAPRRPSTGPEYPVLGSRGLGLSDLRALGFAEEFARAAMAIRTQDDLLDLAANEAPASWQGEAVLDLAFGASVAEVRLRYGFTSEAEQEDGDEATPDIELAGDPAVDSDVLRALERPASRMEFQLIDPGAAGNEELRAAIEDGDFAAWRTFLHPQQRAYAERSRNGAFRLTGGAGTGKTVVLLHRARHLANQDPRARLVLTTFNRTLANGLRTQLESLDATLTPAALGEAGVCVAGVDQLVHRVLSSAGEQALGAGSSQQGAVQRVLGDRTPRILDSTSPSAWVEAIALVPELPAHLARSAFFEAEYGLVILPARITKVEEYLAARRPGRGVALTRSMRRLVWQVVSHYRASAAAAGTTDWDEKALIAATFLDGEVANGRQRPADHVLVDEAQDLTPSRLLFLRALVSPGRNDLFLAEDAHQRIYGRPVVLSRLGIAIRGRSRRLWLNYRTTLQNLRYALGVLEAEDVAFEDTEGEVVDTSGYRSSRRGPSPRRLGLRSLAEEYDTVSDLAREWIEAGVEPADIGILCVSTYAGTKLVGALQERGVAAKLVDRDAVPSTGLVTVMTMHRAKGMEFPRAVLFGANAAATIGAKDHSTLTEDERAENDLLVRSVLYVAATRARDELVVIWHGEPHPALPAVAG